MGMTEWKMDEGPSMFEPEKEEEKKPEEAPYLILDLVEHDFTLTP